MGRKVEAVNTVDGIANEYIDAWARIDPIGATQVGVAGHDEQLNDLSPEGFAAAAELDRSTLLALDQVTPADERERVAKESMVERLRLSLEQYEAGDQASMVSVLSSAMHGVRDVFDLMPTEGQQAVETIARRMAGIPTALAQWRGTLEHLVGKGVVASTAQLVKVADQCAGWAAADRDDYFKSMVGRIGDGMPSALVDELDQAATAANQALVETSEYLRDELAPRGRGNQAVGREHYQRASRSSLGMTVDLDETYAWGIEELHRLETEMAAVANDIVPGGTIEDAVAALESDPNRRIDGAEKFRTWMQELADRTIEELNGTHFDIPEQVLRFDCLIAPTADSGIYYTGPSEDFSRPGRMWWSVPTGVTSFSTWREVTTIYHEGVPGHHLQIGQATACAGDLNRWQRMLSWTSGHGEGWALYAERLMEELGYLEDPGNRLGMLDCQAFRAARVILDIGMHLELEIPRSNPFGFHPGERWTPELGREFLRQHWRTAGGFLDFEINRYLGYPGQAPSYKLGERVWLRMRERAQAARGAEFSLRDFHRDTLGLGSLGLDPFVAAVSRIY